MISEQQFDSAVKRFKKRKDVNPENQEAITRFLDYLKISNRGVRRRLKYLWILTELSRLLEKPFKEANRPDFERVLLEIQNKGLSKNTERDYKILSKKFMAWVYGCGKREYPPCVSWFEIGGGTPKKVDDNELLNESDIIALEARTPRYDYKAVIRVLFETGVRNGELAGLRVKDFRIQEGNYVLRVEGTKTKYSQRTIPLSNSAVQAIKNWLAVHSKKDDCDASLFDLREEAIARNLQRIAERAKISKPVNPHAFRHARATIIGHDPRVTRAQFCYFMGWSQSSNVPEIYMHDLERGTLHAFASFQDAEPRFKETSDKLLASALNDRKLANLFFETVKRTSPDLFKEWLSLAKRVANSDICREAPGGTNLKRPRKKR